MQSQKKSDINTNVTKTKKFSIIKLISIILGIFTLLCVLVSIINNNTSLIIGIIGLILLIIVINITDKISVNKYNSKMLVTGTIIANLISIIPMNLYLIYAYVLVVPSFILSIKSVKNDRKNILNIVSLLISTIFFVACIYLSISGLIIAKNS